MEPVTRSFRLANLLAHEDAFTANPHPRYKYRPDKVKPQAHSPAANRARLLSVFDRHDDDDDDHEDEEAAIGDMVLQAATNELAPTTAQHAQQGRVNSDAVATGVLAEQLQGGAGSPSPASAATGTSTSISQAQAGSASGGPVGESAPGRADSMGCYDLGLLVRQALERYKRERDEALLRQSMSEWVDVSRAASCQGNAALAADLEEACQAALKQAAAAIASAGQPEGGLGCIADEGSDDDFVLVRAI